ncbi:hypothetical protein GCM10027055_13050 [Janibacter alkaliphilus]
MLVLPTGGVGAARREDAGMEKDETADGSAGRRGEADLTGWIRLQMASGLRSSGEIVEALLAGAAGDRLPDADWESAGRESAERRGDERAGDERASGLQAGDELLGRGELEELVARVAAQYREQQPGPSADAQALVSAARGLTTIGLLVALGDEEDETLAREAALRRAAAARAGGAIITGCVYASRAAVEDMVLLGRLELGVAALEEDEHSAVGAQLASALGGGPIQAQAATLGRDVVDQLVAAGLPARWDGGPGSPVVVEPIAYAAPLVD